MTTVVTQNKNQIITKNDILEVCGNTHDTKKKCFSRHSGVQEKKSRPTFSIGLNQKFLKNIFEQQTGLRLVANDQYGQFFCFLPDQQKINEVKEWEKKQGSVVYIADSLTGSIALDYNFTDNTSGKKTYLGEVEELAKHGQDPQAIGTIIGMVAEKISQLKPYNDAPLICAVPCSAGKTFDLPREIAAGVAHILGKENITSKLVLGTQKASIKALPLQQKWDAWEAASLTCLADNIIGKSVVLIDDKYQSGMTLNYTAKKLQEAGVSAVYGLCVVKTLRDTDNAQ